MELTSDRNGPNVTSHEHHVRSVLDTYEQSLNTSDAALAASTVLADAMGDFLFRTFLATRREECVQYAGLDADELIRRLRWRF